MNAVIFLSDLSRKARKASQLMLSAKFRRGMRRGVAAAIEHRPAFSGLEFYTVVDVGANVGQFSLLSWSLWPKAHIYAFEPQAQPAEVFGRVFPRSAPVTLYLAAVGARSGRAEMNVSRRNDCSSLLPISGAMPRILPGTDKVGTADVEIGPLSAYLSAEEIADPALLKIDVQGAELDVLHGCGDLLDRFRYVYAELSFVELYTGQPLCHEIIEFLAARQFRVTSVLNVNSDAQGRPLQADFLFRRTC